MTIYDIIRIQIRESEEETIKFDQEEASEDISNLLARQKQLPLL
jgi:hypothetical protein